MSIHHPYPNEERGHTLKWKDGVTPRVLKSKDDVAAALAAGEVGEFNGTPDTHPNGFIVNCPVPVLAPNTFTDDGHPKGGCERYLAKVNGR